MECETKLDINEAYNIFNSKGDASQYILICREQGLSGCIEYIQQITGCDTNIAEQMIKQHDFLQPSKHQISPAEIAHNNAIAQEWQNKPKCPTCNSTNLKKISATSKVVNTAVFGLFGTKRFKQFHCNNCGYEW